MVVRASDATAEKEGMSPLLDWTDDGMKRRKEGRMEACLLSSDQSRASIRQKVCSHWNILVTGLRCTIVNKAPEPEGTQLMIKLTNCLPRPYQSDADFLSISCLRGK